MSEWPHLVYQQGSSAIAADMLMTLTFSTVIQGLPVLTEMLFHFFSAMICTMQQETTLAYTSIQRFTQLKRFCNFHNIV